MRHHLIFLAIVVGVCLLLYWPALYGPFLFDDFPNLAALTSIDHLDSWRDLGIYLSQPRSFPGRPLAMLSFLPQKASWPDHSFPFKLVNLIIHVINGLLVYRLTWLLGSRYFGGDHHPAETVASRVTIAALLATAAWLLDPIQVSGVLLVIQRMTLLMALFVLLGLLAYLKGLLDENASVPRRGLWMTLGLGVCMVLAFLCKENGILLPLFALVLDATILRTQVAKLPSRLQWWRRVLIWPTVLFVLGYLLSNLSHLASNGGMRDFTLGERLLTEPRVVFDYLANIFLPRFGVYGLYHDGFAISRSMLTPWTTLPAIIGILGAAILGFISRRRRPLLALAILWYLGGQLLESSTVMLELYFEHRNYVPIIGPCIAIAIGIVGTHEPKLRRRLLGVAALWLVACVFTTALSARVYSSEDHLASVWAAKQPNSVRAQNMLAGRFYKHGQLAKALSTIESALEKHPDNAGLAENRVYLKCIQGTLTQADLKTLTTLLRTAPFDRSGFSNMETLRLQAMSRQCPPLHTEQWQALADALLANPFYDGIAKGFLHYQLHLLAVANGNLDAAIRELDAAYATDPNAEIPRLKAQYLASAGLYDQAILVLRNADYSRLPLLRRLLVDDRAINDADIKLLEQQKASSHLREGVR